jgi:hypothetical protein
MNLVRMKIRGLGTTPETHWFSLGSGLNLFHIPDAAAGIAFIKAIQSVNPPYHCQTRQPFSDLPTTITYKEHTRVIRPPKRTIAIGVFSSSPQLVGELAGTSPLFYETDRIEVGRRLDYSRWLNFVELASSTRWSEVSDDIKKLLLTMGNNTDTIDNPGCLIKRLLPTDRIRDHVMDELLNWLTGVTDKIPENHRPEVHAWIEKVKRAHYFSAARKIVKNRLPFFFIIEAKQRPFTELKIEYSDVPDESGGSPLQFLVNLLHEKRSKSETVSGQSHILLEKINQKLEGLEIEQRLSISSNQSTYTLGRHPESGETQNSNQVGSTSLERLCLFVIVASRVMTGSNPVLLFHVNGDTSSDQQGQEFEAMIPRISNYCQCLCVTGDSSSFAGVPEAVRYSSEELMIKKDAPE